LLQRRYTSLNALLAIAAILACVTFAELAAAASAPGASDWAGDPVPPSVSTQWRVATSDFFARFKQIPSNISARSFVVRERRVRAPPQPFV